jgi:hypothetical protein
MEKRYKVIKTGGVLTLEYENTMVKLMPDDIIILKPTEYGMSLFLIYNDIEYESTTMVSILDVLLEKNVIIEIN